MARIQAKGKCVLAVMGVTVLWFCEFFSKGEPTGFPNSDAMAIAEGCAAWEVVRKNQLKHGRICTGPSGDVLVHTRDLL